MLLASKLACDMYSTLSFQRNFGRRPSEKIIKVVWIPTVLKPSNKGVQVTHLIFPFRKAERTNSYLPSMEVPIGNQTDNAC